MPEVVGYSHMYRCDNCNAQRKWGLTHTKRGFELNITPRLLCQNACKPFEQSHSFHHFKEVLIHTGRGINTILTPEE